MSDVQRALDLIARCRDLIDDTEARNQALLYAGRKAGAKAEELAGSYPTKKADAELPLYYDRTDSKGRAYKSKFKSFKQQRKVAMLFKEGKIPYKRGGLLGRAITSMAYVIGQGVAITVGTALSYARYVIGKEDQSNYHKGTWTPLGDSIRDGMSQIIDVFSNALEDYMRGYIARNK